MVVEFRHIKALKTRNSLAGLDVAFVEDAISKPGEDGGTISDACQREIRDASG